MSREEILKKVKSIEIKTKIMSHDLFLGTYRGIFRGNGLEFSNIRKYEFGDDVRKIDWKTTAKFHKTYVKEYEEEREICMYIVADVSKSNIVGNKKNILMELVGCMAQSAFVNKDKCGLILFTEEVEYVIKPTHSQNTTKLFIDKIYDFEAKSEKTNILKVLEYLDKTIKKKSIIIFISDFIDKNNYTQIIKKLSLKHDFTGIRIKNNNITKLPKNILLEVMDAESGENSIIDSSSINRDVFKLDLKNIIDIDICENYIEKLRKYFLTRQKGV